MTSKELSKWSDDFMFTAEPSKASDGVTAYLLGGPVDPLGQIAAAAKMYKGQVVRDLADVTDAERQEYLEQIQKTVLKMPLEAVQMHFMVEGLHRGITHQMVRQRTAAYAQESTRFAVKEDLAEATALAPSLQGTLSQKDLADELRRADKASGLHTNGLSDEEMVYDNRNRLSQEQNWRLEWDRAVNTVDEVYNKLVNDGMPAEEARGLMPTNITTRLNYITNLRSWYDTMAVRVSDQAQFEWRQVAAAMVRAILDYGDRASYTVWVPNDNSVPSDMIRFVRYNEDSSMVEIERSSAWQWTALARELKPIEFKIGGPAFGANFDRPSRIGERVMAFHRCGVPSTEWFEGSDEFSIPGIAPEEYLLDPSAARLNSDEEFDIFGNRVPRGTGDHWVAPHDGERAYIARTDGTGYRWVSEHVGE